MSVSPRRRRPAGANLFRFRIIRERPGSAHSSAGGLFGFSPDDVDRCSSCFKVMGAY